MNVDIQTVKENSVSVAVINSDEVVISDVQSALDLMATIHHIHDCDCMIINKEAVCEDFFVLRTGIAGDILQKFVNYNMKIAIIGDFSGYTSKPLKDFIYESNQGRHVLFLENEKEAISRLAKP